LNPATISVSEISETYPGEINPANNFAGQALHPENHFSKNKVKLWGEFGIAGADAAPTCQDPELSVSRSCSGFDRGSESWE
jgi:hypothetical protein